MIVLDPISKMLVVKAEEVDPVLNSDAGSPAREDLAPYGIQLYESPYGLFSC